MDVENKKLKERPDSKKSLEFQKKLYRIMVSYLMVNKYPPSVRELCDMSGMSSTSTIHGYLEKMHRNGFIEKTGVDGPCSRAYTIRGVKVVIDEEEKILS